MHFRRRNESERWQERSEDETGQLKREVSRWVSWTDGMKHVVEIGTCDDGGVSGSFGHLGIWLISATDPLYVFDRSTILLFRDARCQGEKQSMYHLPVVRRQTSAPSILRLTQQMSCSSSCMKCRDRLFLRVRVHVFNAPILPHYLVL